MTTCGSLIQAEIIKWIIPNFFEMIENNGQCISAPPSTSPVHLPPTLSPTFAMSAAAGLTFAFWRSVNGPLESACKAARSAVIAGAKGAVTAALEPYMQRQREELEAANDAHDDAKRWQQPRDYFPKATDASGTKARRSAEKVSRALARFGA